MSPTDQLKALVVGALCCATFAMPFTSLSDEDPIRVGIAAALDNDGKTLRGTVRFHLNNNTGQTLHHIPVWLYPNRFEVPHENLTDRDVEWIYPRGKSAGSMTLARVSWNMTQISKDSIVFLSMPKGGSPSGAQRMIAEIPLAEPMAPGETGVLELAFIVKIPHRRGRFGRHDGVVTLGGGWFPRPLSDLTGRDTTLPMKKLSASLAVSIPAGTGAVLHDRVFYPQPISSTIEHQQVETDSITLVVMDRMVVTDLQTGNSTIRYVSREPTPRKATWKDTRGRDHNGLPRGLKDLGRRNYPHRALEITREVGVIASRLGLKAEGTGDLLLVEVPAWDRLVQTGSGPILLSERIWRLFNTERVLSFHDIALARQVATSLARERSSRLEPLIFRDRGSEMLGDLIATLYAEQAHGGGETVKDLVGFAAFIPYIDNLLYAPQIPFREAFSRSVEIPDTLRDELSRFMNEQPRGRRVLAKLIDRIGWDKTVELASEAIETDRSLWEVTNEYLGEKAKRFFEDWMGPYPSVNYRIEKSIDVKKPNGVYSHRVTIEREGDDIREPVVVEIVDEDENRTRKTWDGDGKMGTVAWESDAEIDQVHVDPDGRLVEDPSLTEDHPLADNRRSLPWRPPMITQLLIWGDAVTFEPFVYLSFSMRKLYDVSNSYRFYLDYTPRGYAASVRYIRHFGKKSTLNSRSWYAGPFLAIRRTLEVKTEDMSIPEETLFAATLGSVGAVFGMDNRKYGFDPRQGGGFSTGVGYMGGRADDGHPVHLGKISVRGTAIGSPAIGHNLALTGGVLSAFGEPPAVELSSLSDRTRLRAFGLDETYGRIGLYASAEYRHTLAMGTPVELPAGTNIFKLQGVLFAGAGTISWPADYTGMFEKERIFVEAGYGLRAQFLVLGALQYMLALDLAVPIHPQNRVWRLEDDDGRIREVPRQPFKLVFGITQTY